MKHIKTVTERQIDLFDFRGEDVCDEDVAHALACINRFNGHLISPVNVATHSYYVSRYVEAVNGAPKEIQLQALLHDAAEAYVGDVTKWLKDSPEMSAFREAEDKIQRTIFRVYGVPEEQDERVTWADRRCCAYEAARGGMRFEFSSEGYHQEFDAMEREVFIDWEFGTWAATKWVFLRRLERLTR